MTTDQTPQAQSCQTNVLRSWRDDAVMVSVYLKSGIRLQGQIGRVDSYSLLLRGVTDQVIFKHAISTIAPTRIE